MKLGKSHRIRPSMCPGCGAVHNAGCAVGSNRAPRPDDPSVCIVCGSLLKYGPDLVLEPLPLAEFKALGPELQKKLRLGQMAVFRLPPFPPGRTRPAGRA